MFTQFITIGLLTLFSAMLPGPDFALVTKNAITYSRRAGFFTSFGVATAIGVHMTYCVLGLAIVIANSLWLFNAIRYLGAAYLFYLGIQSVLANKTAPIKVAGRDAAHKRDLPPLKAFWQGFLCNLLNPKATLFFLALFTVVVKPGTSGWWAVLIALEVMSIACLWFCTLTLFLSHPRIVSLLNKAEHLIEKILGIMLIGFGIALVLIKV